jgi:mono/diheme cytochrome c family protein
VKKLLAALVVLVTGGTAVAGCYPNVVVTPVLVPSFAFQFVSPFVAVASTPVPAGPPQKPVDDGPPAAPLPEGQSVRKPALASGAHLAVLKTNCASCHSGAGGRGGVQIFDAAGNYAPNVAEDDLWTAAAEGRMPPKKRLAAKDLSKLSVLSKD